MRKLFTARALLAILLAQTVSAAEPAGFTHPAVEAPCEAASASLADEPGFAPSDECRHPFLLVLGREEELDRLGLECETGVEGGVHPTEHGFLRLLDRERRALSDLLRLVYGPLLHFGVGAELTDEAHVIRLPGAEEVAGEHVAHCLVFADSAREALRAAAAAIKAVAPPL